jgi:rsbT co-antagonist protein RsbR
MTIKPADRNGAPFASDAHIAALEARLAEAEARAAHYQRIAEAAPSVLYLFDLVEQRNTYANQELTDLLGYSAAEVQALGDRLFATILHPDDLKQIIASHAQLAATADGEAIEVTYRMRHADGSWRWLSSREVVFARDGDGTPTQKLGAVVDVTAQMKREQELLMLQAVLEHSPEGIGVSALDGTQVYANPAFCALLGYGPELIGQPYEIYMEESDPEAVTAIMEHGFWQGEARYRRKDGSSFHGSSTSFIIRDAHGQPQWMGGLVRDMSAQLRAEEERLTLQQQVIEAQDAALRELSTPLIPLAAGIVVMPLIGSIDSKRAQQVLDELLSGVAQHHATSAILDITGVPVVDTQVAQALLRAAQAVKLLGARVILTGIRPEIAQTIVGLGLDMNGIVTQSSLQSGIALALARRS